MPNPYPPERLIGEVLGVPAAHMRDPVGAGYRCPFINGACVKRGHHIAGPYPVCSVRRKTNPELITVCPQRFLQADLVNDVIEHCWPGDPPRNPRVAREVSMSKFGQVDLVIADFDEDARRIDQFVSVELQAVDTTGSVEPAYRALLNSEAGVDVQFGINWANVRRRYIDQLIAKSFFHHQWGTRVVAVMQTPLYDYIRLHMNFDELQPGGAGIDVAFMLYDYVEGDAEHTLVFDRVVNTSHNSLMTSTLYQQPPPRDAFARLVLDRLEY